MAASKGQLILQWIVLCFTFYLVSPLTLPYMTTRKPRITKYSTSTAPPAGAVQAGTSVPAATAPVTPNQPLYKVTASNGATCILLKTDALIAIFFKSNIGNEEGDIYVPPSPAVSGTCEDDKSTMRMVWTGYILDWKFAKTPGGERWYVEKIELTVSTELPLYRNIRTSHGKSFQLSHTNNEFMTPVGRSYTCKNSTVDLTPSEENAPAGLGGRLELREFQLQPFMYKKGGAKFGPIFECNVGRTFRDETAPIAVGSTLAVAVLLTVTGYGVFRYMKVKKVQYNTME